MNINPKEIFSLADEQAFQNLALRMFDMQIKQNQVYRDFVKNAFPTNFQPEVLSQIPFLPISFFKQHRIACWPKKKEEICFLSSGTGGMSQSRHYVSDLSVYDESFLRAFELFYGPAKKIRILALLPAYLERKGSSLIYMVEKLIKISDHEQSGFYLNNLEELSRHLAEPTESKTLLIGVSFALLDLAEQFPQKLGNTIVMETGGMKGRRKEMIREELHESLCNAFGLNEIHSEYGMTELLSQAYSNGNGRFYCPPWMKVLIRDTNDPFTIFSRGKSGGINVIDLANINSCPFIATQDLGKRDPDGSFEVLGRFDESDVRGCNLMVI